METVDAVAVRKVDTFTPGFDWLRNQVFTGRNPEPPRVASMLWSGKVGAIQKDCADFP